MLISLGGLKRFKFIDILHGYIKKQVENNYVKMLHVPSEQQNAEILTKPLGRIKFGENRRTVGVVHVEQD